MMGVNEEFDVLYDGVNEEFNVIYDGVNEEFNVIYDGVIEEFNVLYDGVNEEFNVIYDGVNEEFNVIYDGVNEEFNVIYDGVDEEFIVLYDGVNEEFNVIYDGVNEEFNVLYDGVNEEFNVAKAEERKWLDLMTSATVVEESSVWAKYHSNVKSKEVEEIGIQSILSLIDKPVHSLKAQHHCMNIIAGRIKYINPGQIPVDTCDQPVFALTKEEQWRYPEKFSDVQYFSILGGGGGGGVK